MEKHGEYSLQIKDAENDGQWKMAENPCHFLRDFPAMLTEGKLLCSIDPNGWRLGEPGSVHLRNNSLPSGKHTKNYGTSPCFIGKLTKYQGPCSIAM